MQSVEKSIQSTEAISNHKVISNDPNNISPQISINKNDADTENENEIDYNIKKKDDELIVMP